MFDLWSEAKEDWSVVQVMYERFEVIQSSTFSMEQYRTRSQLLKDYAGDQALVDGIIEDKRKRGPPWCIPHPERPDIESGMLYLSWQVAGKKDDKISGKKVTLHDTVDITADEDDNMATVINSVMSNDIDAPALKVGNSTITAPDPQPEQKPKPVPKPKATRPPYDVARARTTKLANNVKANIRSLAAVILEIDASQATGDKDLYMAKSNRLHDDLRAVEGQQRGRASH